MSITDNARPGRCACACGCDYKLEGYAPGEDVCGACLDSCPGHAPLDLVPARYVFEISEVNDDRGRVYCETWVTCLDSPGTWGEFGPTVYAQEDPHRAALPLAIRRAFEAGAVRVIVKPYPPHVLAPEWPECIR